MMKARGITTHRFTLIELLMVLGIASAVMALAIPAFTRMVAGNKVDEMAGRLKLGLEQAQSLAATENRYVALVLPNGNISKEDYPEAYRNLLGGYRPAFVNRSGSGGTITFTFDRWVDGHDWKNAPEENVDAAVLAKVTDSNTGLPQKPLSNGEVSTASDAVIGGTGSNIGIANCAAKKTSATFSGLLALTSNPIEPDASTVAVVFNPRGGIMNTHDLYFVIAAAKISGTDVTYPAFEGAATTPIDYRILKLHQYTGRVEFR